uniref:Tyrosine-protein phosphatase domain-containing protein n=1 Tax=Clytia hemisphaerica TaxID=252671 RepID=A0A7M5X1K8_9CNID
MRLETFLLVVSLFGAAYSAAPKVPKIYSYQFQIQLENQTCSISLIENRDVLSDNTYGTLKSSLTSIISNLYKSASDSSEFYSTSAGKFQCISKSKIAFSFMVSFSSNETTKDIAKLILQTETQDADLGGYKVDPKILESEVKSFVPATRNTLKTEVPNYIFCDPRHYEHFREQLSKKLIVVTDDGVSTIDKAQIIFPRHSCGDTTARFKQATFDFYVSVLNEPFDFDKKHTSLAYRVIDQMIYDGSTWKVGLAFDKKIDSITLHEGIDYHDGFSDVEIIYLGFGIVCTVLIIIIIIILLARYCCGCCGDHDVIDIQLQKNIEEIEFGTYLVKSDHNKNEGAFVNNAYERNTYFVNDDLVQSKDEGPPRKESGSGSSEEIVVDVAVSLPEGAGNEIDEKPPIEITNEGVVEVEPTEDSLVDSILAEFPEKVAEPEQETSFEPVEPERETAPLVEEKVVEDSPVETENSPYETEDSSVETKESPAETEVSPGDNLNESSDELLIVPPVDYPQGEEDKDEVDCQEPPMEISASFVRSSSRIESSSSSDDSSSDDEDEEDELLDKDELIARLQDEEPINMEFASLDARVPTVRAYEGSLINKNRSSNKFPWTHKRVTLKRKPGDPNSDYINASFVKNAKRQVAYISTQAPLANTVQDFWNLIWERNVSLIVMATSIVFEEEDRYWPSEENTDGRYYGNYHVKTGSMIINSEYSMVLLQISGGGVSRDIVMYQYTNWSTTGSNIPHSIESLLGFVLDIRGQLQNLEDSFPVFHGSSLRRQTKDLNQKSGSSIT